MHWAESWLPAALSPLINNDNICFVCFDSLIFNVNYRELFVNYFYNQNW